MADDAAILTPEDLKALAKTGMTAAEGMRTRDFIQTLEHVLQVTCRRGLADFILPEVNPLPASHLSVWVAGRVWRFDPLELPEDPSQPLPGGFGPGPASPKLQTLHPELPAEGLSLEKRRVLILDIDQEGIGWAACHALATGQAHGGMGLMLLFEGDWFHRMWNDLRTCMRYSLARLNHTCIQMSVAYNCPYGPWMRGANLSKERGFALTFLRWFEQQAAHSPQGQSLYEPLPNIVAEWSFHSAQAEHDLGHKSSDSASEQELMELFWRQIAGNDSLRLKGHYCKMGAWFSIFGAATAHDSQWTVWRFCSFWLAKFLLGQDSFDSRVQQKVAKDMLDLESRAATMTAAEQRAEVIRLRRHTGNVLALVPFLLHNHNLFNIRLLLLVGTPLWTLHTTVGARKVTAEANLQFNINMSTGAEEAMLRDMWRRTTGNAEALGRLGLATVPNPYPMGPSDLGGGMGVSPGVRAEDMPKRVMDFLLRVIRLRLRASHHATIALPGALAGLLSSDLPTAQARMAWVADVWQLILDVEGCANTLPAAADVLKKEVHWLQWTLVQYTFRFLAHHQFQLCPPVLCHLRRLWTRIGDSKVIEDSHAIIRDLEQREQKADSASCQAVYHRLSKGDVLDTRGLPRLAVEKEDFVRPPPRPPGVNGAHIFHATSTTMPPELGVNRVMDKKKRYTTRRPGDSHGAAAALEALRLLHSPPPPPAVPFPPAAAATTTSDKKNTYQSSRLDLAGQLWQAGVLGPGTVVEYHPGAPWQPQVHLVLCPEACAARTAQLVQHEGLHLLDPRATWQWTLVLDARQWREIPGNWVLQRHDVDLYGFFGFKPERVTVPVAVSALLRAKPDTITMPTITKLAGVYDLQLQAGKKWPRALELAEHVLAGHPDRDHWLQQIQRGDPVEQASEPEDGEDDVIQDLSAVSLQELPPDEQKEFPREQARFRKGQGARALAAQALRREAGGFPEPPPEEGDPPAEPLLTSEPLPLSDAAALGPAPPPPAPLDPGGDLPADAPASTAPHTTKRGDESGDPRRAATRRPWVNELLPQPAVGTTNLCLYAPPERHHWEGRYEHPDCKGRQKTFSRNWGDRTRSTRHQAFVHVLTKLWERHTTITKQTPPARVQQALQSCKGCGCKFPTECSWLSLAEEGREELAAPPHSQPPQAVVSTPPGPEPPAKRLRQARSTDTSALPDQAPASGSHEVASHGQPEPAPIQPRGSPGRRSSSRSSSSSSSTSSSSHSSRSNTTATKDGSPELPANTWVLPANDIEKVAADGSCLFTCVARACFKILTGTEPSSTQHTQDLGRNMRSHFVSTILVQAQAKADWESVRLELEASSGLRWATYQKAISQVVSRPEAARATWGGAAELRLLCQHFGVGCTIHRQVGASSEGRLVIPTDVVTPGSVDSSRWFHLLWTGDHYDLIRPGAQQRAAQRQAGSLPGSGGRHHTSSLASTNKITTPTQPRRSSAGR